MKGNYHTNKLRFGFLLLLVLCAGGSVLTSAFPATSASLPLNQFINRVEQSYHNVRAIRANFTQTYDSGGGSRVESGTVVFARGGRMRWDYRQPEKKVFLSNKKEVLLYLPEEHQLNRSSVKHSEDYRIPFRLLLSRLDLRKVFAKFEDAGSEIQHPAGDRVILAYPKHARKLGYKRVVMEFDPQLNIRRLIITYSNDSVMKFEFSNIQRNPVLSASLFELKPPPGTQIINQE